MGIQTLTSLGQPVTHVTLANALSFKVVAISVNLKNVVLSLSRYSKKEERTIFSELVVTNDGYYLPGCEKNPFDVVKFNTGEYEHMTPAGSSHTEHQNFNLIDMPMGFGTKIQTRNGLWYTFLGRFISPDKNSVVLELGLLSPESRVRRREFNINGLDKPLTPRAFSPHDIVRIEQI